MLRNSTTITVLQHYNNYVDGIVCLRKLNVSRSSEKEGMKEERERERERKRENKIYVVIYR